MHFVSLFKSTISLALLNFNDHGCLFLEKRTEQEKNTNNYLLSFLITKCMFYIWNIEIRVLGFYQR